MRRKLKEDINKGEINSMIDSKIDSMLKSRDFETAVRKISADALNNLFRALYQKNNIWMSDVKR